MPELPEVETLRRALTISLVGRTFGEVEIRQPKMFVAADGWQAEDLTGRTILALRRRAKFLIFDVTGDAAVVVHLRLSGQLVHRASDGGTLAEGGHPVPRWGAPLPHKSTHMSFHLDDGSVLFLTDIRQFGRAWLLPAVAVEPLLARSRLGPEPLDPGFTLETLGERLRRRPRAQAKSLLLDQSFIGGVGNIYADEIIFESGLRPTTLAAEIVEERLERFHSAIRSVLELAVRDGVAEILNGRAALGRDFPRVHGRAGQPCPRCGTAVMKTRFGGRGTYTCPSCQGGIMSGPAI